VVVLIDNYDSFVHNLGRYIGQLGFEYLICRNDAFSLAQLDALQPSHVVISPGPCTPNQAGISLYAIEHFALKRIPILGVCLGHQAIGQVFGARIVKAKKPMHGMNCFISHSGKGILKGLKNPLKVGRYHSLIIHPQGLSDCIEITGYSQEMEIMAIQHKSLPIFGVQFHPESILTEQGYELLENFLNS
jgi:anthranilate synthase/aminodeoxychorismate synthase-like glutamine amidotransferase